MHTERHSTIRSIGRGLAVLRVINRYGCVSLGIIAEKSEVPYPTASRIVQTLVSEGMVERAGTRRYRPTALVQTLSLGYQPEDELANIARPHLIRLTEKVLWPAYLLCRVGTNMLVKESTDSLTSLTITRCTPGYSLPLLESSSGKAYLAFTPPQERDVILKGAFSHATSIRRPTQDATSLLAELKEIRQRGYATISRHPYTENPGKTSAISVPVLNGDRAIAALAILFFSSSMEITTAVRAFLEILKSTAKAVAAGFHA